MRIFGSSPARPDTHPRVWLSLLFLGTAVGLAVSSRSSVLDDKGTNLWRGIPSSRNTEVARDIEKWAVTPLNPREGSETDSGPSPAEIEDGARNLQEAAPWDGRSHPWDLSASANILTPTSHEPHNSLIGPDNLIKTISYATASSAGARNARSRPWSRPASVDTATSGSLESHHSSRRGSDSLPMIITHTKATPWSADDRSIVKRVQNSGRRHQQQKQTHSWPSGDSYTLKGLKKVIKKHRQQQSSPSWFVDDGVIIRGLHGAGGRHQGQNQEASSDTNNHYLSRMSSIQQRSQIASVGKGFREYGPAMYSNDGSSYRVSSSFVSQPHSQTQAPPNTPSFHPFVGTLHEHQQSRAASENQRPSRIFSTQELYSVIPSGPKENDRFMEYSPTIYSSADASLVSSPDLNRLQPQPQTEIQTQTQVPLSVSSSFPSQMELLDGLDDSSSVRSLKDLVERNQQLQPHTTTTTTTQHLPGTFTEQLSLTRSTPEEEDRIMKYGPTTYSTNDTFLKQHHPQPRSQTQPQTPVDLPTSLTRIMDVYFGLNLSDTRNRYNLLTTSTQPPVLAPTEEEIPIFPSGQPYIPAFHQLYSISSPPQGSEPSEEQLVAVDPVSLFSTGTSSSGMCFSSVVCAFGVALFMALGATSLFLLPFQIGRKRSLDEGIYLNEILKKDFAIPPSYSDMIMTDPHR